MDVRKFDSLVPVVSEGDILLIHLAMRPRTGFPDCHNCTSHYKPIDWYGWSWCQYQRWRNKSSTGQTQGAGKNAKSESGKKERELTVTRMERGVRAELVKKLTPIVKKELFKELEMQMKALGKLQKQLSPATRFHQSLSSSEISVFSDSCSLADTHRFLSTVILSRPASSVPWPARSISRPTCCHNTFHSRQNPTPSNDLSSVL